MCLLRFVDVLHISRKMVLSFIRPDQRVHPARRGTRCGCIQPLIASGCQLPAERPGSTLSVHVRGGQPASSWWRFSDRCEWPVRERFGGLDRWGWPVSNGICRCAASGRNTRAKVVLPAPFGPAMIRMRRGALVRRRPAARADRTRPARRRSAWAAAGRGWCGGCGCGAHGWRLPKQH